MTRLAAGWLSLLGLAPATASAQNFYPGGGNYDVGTYVQVHVTVCSSGNFDSQGVISLNDAPIGSTSPSFDPGCNDFQAGDVGFTVAEGANVLSLRISDQYGSYYGEETYWGVVPPPPPPVPPIVTPAAASRPIAPITTTSLTFAIRNPDPYSRTYTVTVTCSGVVTGCSVPTPATIGAGKTIDVAPTFSVSGSPFQTGSLTLIATAQDSANPADTGTIAVSVPPSGAVVARNECLTIAVGAGAAYECGDLRLTHALPAVRTVSKARVPVLIYNGQTAHPSPLVGVDVTLPTIPTTVRAVLWIDNTRRDSTDWPGSAWGSAGQTRHVVQRWLAGADTTTGLYNYRLDIKLIGPGVDSLPPILGQIAIVNRRASPFGPGWWVAGYERLLSMGMGPGITATQALWIGGDGSARRYDRAGTVGADTAYLAPPLDGPDTLLHTSSGLWIRRLSGGGQVVFLSTGLHRRTVTRLGDSTVFVDSSGYLSRINMPRDAALQYTFGYSGTPARLSTVSVPDSGVGTFRVTNLVWAGDSVRITDPGTTAPVTYRYQTGSTNRMASRTSRRGAVTRFLYNTAFRLDSVKTALGGADSINLSFCAAESKGIVACSPIILAPESVYTRFDGPRAPTDSADVVHFWVDRFGAPWKIRDPYGNITTLSRTDPSWVTLTTRAQYPNGRITGATYDARGNLASSTDSSLYVTGDHATTRYTWDQTWDEMTEIVLPTGEVTHFGYDAVTGNRLWQEDGRGTPSRVNFAYYTSGNGTGLVKTITDPTGAKDSVAYDSRGNAVYSKTPMGYVTTSVVDRIGRPTVVLTPSSSVTRHDSTSYDQRGLPLRTVAFGPAVNGVAAQKVVVQNFYNVDGQVDSVQRSSVPDDALMGMITTRWRYDLAGRVVAEISPDLQRDSTRYDRAGNADTVVTRRGDTLTMAYDRLNHLRRRVVPPVVYHGHCKGMGSIGLDGDVHPYPWFADQAPGLACMNDGSGYTIDSTQWTLTLQADTARFSYGSMGELLTADNRDAMVQRTYFKDGQVATDTQRLRTWNGTDFSLHMYGLSYTYDLSGRRLSLRHPWALAPRAPSVRDLALYEYDPTIGALSAVVDPLGNRFEFTYDMRNERVRLRLPGGITDTTIYDVDGRLLTEKILNNSSSHYRNTDAVLRNRTLTYADEVRVSDARNTAGYRDTTTTTYSGLGHVVRNLFHAPAANEWFTATVSSDEQVTLDALGNPFSNYELSSYQASVPRNFGGSSHTFASRFGALTAGAATGRRRGANHVYPSSLQADAQDTILYDAAGNTAFSYQTSSSAHARLEDHAYFYGADGQLRVSEYRTTPKPATDGQPWEMVFEEYRYDALGRRVAVHTRRATHMPSGCAWYRRNVGTLRRTVWDGDAELYEIQTAAGRTCYGPPDDGPYLENDTLPLIVHSNPGTPPSADFSPMFGRVAYTYGAGVDQPLSAIRINLVDSMYNKPRAMWGPIAIAPHWNWRGQADYGLLADGGKRTCLATDTLYCVNPPWRVRGLMYTEAQADSAMGWWGTLLSLKEDATGTQYRRNRYLDPATGRFTQEDPIGLAGGLNLYGFANGDPVNFSDPLGLRPCCLGPGGAFGTMTPELRNAIREGLRQIVAKLKKGWDEFLFTSQFVPIGTVTGPARGFSSFWAFKTAAGPAGVGMHWHHIVGQTTQNIERFGASLIHNTDNLIALDAATHAQISGYYSSKQAFTNGQTVREWLSGQSFEAQREFGLKVLREHGVIK